MYIVLIATIVLLLIYSVLIAYYGQAWRSMPVFEPLSTKPTAPLVTISVIIAARNEEANIANCLAALQGQTYPAHLLEVIVVNDHSSDRTVQEAASMLRRHWKIIELKDHLMGKPVNAYKKKALEVGISAAAGELIVTTDADCTAPQQWLQAFAEYYQLHQPVFMAAPVKLTTRTSLLSIFQTTDFITLQGITGASVYKQFHSMCNGANLAYEKKVFFEVGGFNGIDQIASGDDMLLMHKIARKYPGRISFLKSKSAIVTTLPADTWQQFFRQRIRWASKSDKYDDKTIIVILALVYFLNLLLLVLLISGLFNPTWLLCFLLLVVSKTIAEFFFVKNVASFFNQQKIMAYFPFLQPLHIVYTVIAGWLGKFGTYQWKDRKVS